MVSVDKDVRANQENLEKGEWEDHGIIYPETIKDDLRC